MELLRFMPGVTLVRVSRYRDTRPIGGPPGQGLFLNGACLIETELAPHDVLGMLAAVENTLHRERGDRWGPRTVDLDLLLYDGTVLDTETLTLPHPRMVTRRFVLEPCVEIAPDLVHPLAGCRLDLLLESISTPRPHVAVVGIPGSGAEQVAAEVSHATLARLVTAPPEYALVEGRASGHAPAVDERLWQEAVAACARPLAASRCGPDPHGVVSDYWLQTVLMAAADALPPEGFARLAPSFTAAAAETMPPHVAILLVAAPDTIEERLAQPERPHAAACTSDRVSIARLLRLQDRLVAALRGLDVAAGRWAAPPVPRAVVTIAAGDLRGAGQEAVAAVEAMA